MYRAESFNFIHARSMLQGVKDFPSFFSNIRRMLRPGGVFVTMEGKLTTWDENGQSIEYKEEGQPVCLSSWFEIKDNESRKLAPNAKRSTLGIQLVP